MIFFLSGSDFDDNHICCYNRDIVFLYNYFRKESKRLLKNEKQVAKKKIFVFFLVYMWVDNTDRKFDKDLVRLPAFLLFVIWCLQTMQVKYKKVFTLD